MLVLSQAPGGALSTKRCSLSSPPTPNFSKPNPLLFSYRRHKFSPRPFVNLTLATKQDISSSSSSSSTNPSPFQNDQETVFVGEENVPLEGVIQFDKPTSSSSSSRLDKWGYCNFKNSDISFFSPFPPYWEIYYFKILGLLCFSVGLLCLLVGMFWLCFCSPQLGGSVTASLSLTLRRCAQRTLLLPVLFVLVCLN